MRVRRFQQHQEEYAEQGYTILREVLSTSLLHELQIIARKAQQIALANFGPSARRLISMYRYSLDPIPFRQFSQLQT